MTTLIDVLAAYDKVVRGNRDTTWDTLREVSNPDHRYEIVCEFSDAAMDVGFNIYEDVENMTMTPAMELAIDALLDGLLAVYRVELRAELGTLGRDHFGEVFDDPANMETTDTDENGLLYCPDCQRPTYYDVNDNAYHHASDGFQGCFLIAADPVLKAEHDERMAAWQAKYDRDRQAKAAENAIAAANAFVKALSTI